LDEYKYHYLTACEQRDSLAFKLKAAQESLRAHMKVLSILRDKHGVSAGLIGDIFDEEEL